MFRSLASAHQRKLCQMVSLPTNVKDILRQKKDETSWPKIQQLARTVLDATQGLRTVVLDDQGCKDLANALDATPSTTWFDDIAIGVGDLLPAGSRVLVDLGADEDKVDSSTRRGAIADRVRQAVGAPIRVFTRPFGCRYSSGRPPIAPFCKDHKKYWITSAVSKSSPPRRSPRHGINNRCWINSC